MRINVTAGGFASGMQQPRRSTVVLTASSTSLTQAGQNPQQMRSTKPDHPHDNEVAQLAPKEELVAPQACGLLHARGNWR